MVFEISAEQFFKAAGYLIAGIGGAGAMTATAFHTIRRIIGKGQFQMSAGDAIAKTSELINKQEQTLNDINNNMKTQKEVFTKLLNYAEESARLNLAISKLLETYITRN